CALPGQVSPPLFGPEHVYHQGMAGPDPEGVLSTVGAVVSVILGWCVGEVLRRDRRWRVLGALAAAAALAWGMPVIKRVWTPSFVLATAAITTMVLVVLVAVADVADHRAARLRAAGR